MVAYKCNLIVAGFPKCGTSSLHEYLDQHPDICMSYPKEPHYFTRKDQWVKGVEYHNGLFPQKKGPGCIRFYGESTTTYCISHDAIERIAKNLDSPKIIFLLRDPVDRVISHYRWLYKLGLETETLSDILERSPVFEFNPDDHLSGCYKSYIAFSSYGKFIPMWLERFGEENIYFISSDELRSDPLNAMNKCFKFLGVDTVDRINNIELNNTKNTRIVGSSLIGESHFLHKIRKALPEDYKKMILKLPMIRRVWERVSYGKNRDVPPITNEDIQVLNSVLEKDVLYYNGLFKSG